MKRPWQIRSIQFNDHPPIEVDPLCLPDGSAVFRGRTMTMTMTNVNPGALNLLMFGGVSPGARDDVDRRLMFKDFLDVPGTAARGAQLGRTLKSGDLYEPESDREHRFAMAGLAERGLLWDPATETVMPDPDHCPQVMMPAHGDLVLAAGSIPEPGLVVRHQWRETGPSWPHGTYEVRLNEAHRDDLISRMRARKVTPEFPFTTGWDRPLPMFGEERK